MRRTSARLQSASGSCHTDRLSGLEHPGTGISEAAVCAGRTCGGIYPGGVYGQGGSVSDLFRGNCFPASSSALCTGIPYGSHFFRCHYLYGFCGRNHRGHDCHGFRRAGPGDHLKEISGSLACDGFASVVSALFGCPPVTSFSQNVGLVNMTKVVNRFTIATGAGCMLLAGFLPPVGNFFCIPPGIRSGGVHDHGCSGPSWVSGIQMAFQGWIYPAGT